MLYCLILFFSFLTGDRNQALQLIQNLERYFFNHPFDIMPPIECRGGSPGSGGAGGVLQHPLSPCLSHVELVL
jgi:hypothetical protein